VSDRDDESKTGTRQKSHRLTTAWATVILGLCTVASGFFGHWIGTSSSSPKPHVASMVPPPSISISEPAPGAGISQYPGIVSGRVRNLRPGQTVWVFNNVAKYPGSIYLTVGPCAISGTTWTCGYVYVGKSSYDHQTYTIWAAVVSSEQTSLLGHFVASGTFEVVPPVLPASADVAHYKEVVHRCGSPKLSGCS
jgi:hypothetical protein